MTLNANRKKEKLRLHPKQFEVFRDGSRFKVVVAGRRWGKTQLAKTKITTKARIPDQLIWYVAPTYRMAKQLMWRELLKTVPQRWIKNINHTDLMIELINGTILECKGADKPDTLRGVGLDYIVLDEFQDMRPEVWDEVLRPTLAATKGCALFIGTPKAFNHLYDKYQNGQKPEFIKSGLWRSWQFPTITSPFIPQSEIMAAKEEMDQRTFRQEFEASFETMSGRVYYPFDRRVHVKPCPFNPELPIWVGQDFNIDPMCSVIMQPQVNGEIWVVDEIYQRSSNTMEICQELERRYWKHQKQVIIYPDPASSSRQHARGETDLDIFKEHGFETIKKRSKHPRIRDRVNSVNSMLMSSTGEVSLYFDPKAKETIKGVEQTIYKPGTSDVDKSAGTEHPTDALGYPIELERGLHKIKIMGTNL